MATGIAVDLRKPDLVPPADALEIDLRDCSLRVSGVVHDGAGGVIPGAHVRGGSSAEELGLAVADASGSYLLCLSSGPGHREAWADGYGRVLQHSDCLPRMPKNSALRRITRARRTSRAASDGRATIPCKAFFGFFVILRMRRVTHHAPDELPKR